MATLTAKRKTIEKNPPRTLQQTDVLLTVVVVVENDQDILKKVISQIVSLISQEFQYYEILVIDNGSSDGSVELVKDLQQFFPNIRLLVLSRNYPLEVAFSAALDNSIGDWVVLMDISFDPPKLIPTLVSKAQQGYDIVVGERKDRSDNTFLERWFANTFYKLSGKILGFHFSSNASYFRVLSRRVVNSVIRIRNKNRYLKYFSALVGFKHATIIYKRVPLRKKDRHKRSFFRSTGFALDILLSNSSAPLRFAALLGAVASFGNLVFLGYVFTVAIIKRHVAEGWITSSVMSATMFFLVFIILTIMSEYIARILSESKDQPLYFIAEESTSNVTRPEREKINVV